MGNVFSSQHQPQSIQVAPVSATGNPFVTQDLQEPFPILALPPELIDLVSTYLEDSDLLIFRRVCRALNAHSTNVFGKRFFWSLEAFLHPISLTTLFEICRHPTLAKYVHQVTVHGDQFQQQKHKDLQSSVEQSGMDRMLLTEVFKGLANLTVVAAGILPWNNEPDDGAGISCARRHLFDTEDLCGPPPDRGFSRVYGLVLQAIQDANLQDKVDLLFDFWGAATPDEAAGQTCIDLASSAWKQNFAKRVRGIALAYNADPDWVRELFSSATNLYAVNFCGNNFTLQLPSPSVGLHSKASIRSLELANVFLSHADWIVFLRLHAETLERLTILP